MPTTVSLSNGAKESLEKLRHPDHEDWDDVISTIVGILPSYDQIADSGCKNCGGEMPADVPLDQSHGYVHWTRVDEEQGGMLYTEWFCSRPCLEATLEEQEKYAPRRPDLVAVGGREQPRVELDNATFGIDGAAMFVGLDVPGAFTGGERGDGEFSYEGEPVYVKNRGEWVHSGVIESIFHEEGRTNLDLASHSFDVPIRLYHPEDAVRERYQDEYMPLAPGRCESCDTGYRYPAHDPPEECPECESEEIENEGLDEDELTDVEIDALEGRVPGIGDDPKSGELEAGETETKDVSDVV